MEWLKQGRGVANKVGCRFVRMLLAKLLLNESAIGVSVLCVYVRSARVSLLLEVIEDPLS